VRRAQIDDHIQTWRRFRWPGVIALSLPVTSSALLQLTRFFRDMIRQHKLREYADDPQAAHTLRGWQPNANHGTPLKNASGTASMLATATGRWRIGSTGKLYTYNNAG